MKEEITINKLYAVQEQLKTAIFLFFHDGDPISIHTLTAAAYNILHDICHKKNYDPMLIRGSLLKYVRPGKESIYLRHVKKAENFLSMQIMTQKISYILTKAKLRY